MSGRVEGKVALITGAGSGIGRASAIALAREGAVVVATDLSAENAGETAELIAAEGGRARAMAHDVAEEAAWQAVFASLGATEGRLDIVLNNAGIGNNGMTLAETSLPEWRRINAINVEGVFLGTKYAIEMMAETEGGSIINVSSIYGLVGADRSVAYNASKGAVRLLTKGAAIECGRAGNGVRVNSIHPGFIETPLTRRLFDDDTFRARMIGRTPLGRGGKPEDIANGVVFLASDESAFMTGAELVIDGGFTAN